MNNHKVYEISCGLKTADGLVKDSESRYLIAARSNQHAVQYGLAKYVQYGRLHNNEAGMLCVLAIDGNYGPLAEIVVGCMQIDNLNGETFEVAA